MTLLRQNLAMDFDPGAASAPDSGIFGLPHGPEDARVHVRGVPFEATTSYRAGTARAPEAVQAASRQIDLFDLRFGRPYEAGIWMAPVDAEVRAWSEEARALALPIIAQGGAGPEDSGAVARVDELGARVNERVRRGAIEALDAGKLPVLVGGDHSTPFGQIAACAERAPGLGVLQFDAHADLRPAFEGLRWSHASILDNVLRECDGVAALVQVGIRDLSEEEFDAAANEPRVRMLTDVDLGRAREESRTRALAREAIAELPDDVYVTFDVDALEPSLCPNTGTPVPGGLSWAETMVWLEELRASGKRVVGLDLVEVSPGLEWNESAGDAWDAIVGARLLYRLIGAALGD
ncbi:MAG: agmatinase family protein [Planctomycetota bacterium]